MSCFMVREPTVTVIYIFVMGSALYRRLAMKFVKYYTQRDPGYPHRLVIACNGGRKLEPTDQKLFTLIAEKRFHMHDNTGWDLGAYQSVALGDKSDLLVFMGSSCFPTRPGWLKRIMESYNKHGDALYGSMHHYGDPKNRINPHIRTTGFWMPRELFVSYPIRIRQHSQRYEFEHGKTCLTAWIENQGLKAVLVTWDKDLDRPNWRKVTNGYHQGNQSALLFRDRLTEPPYF